MTIGVTRQTIHSIEKGKFIPSALLAFKIARYFKCNVEDIFYLEEYSSDEMPGSQINTSDKQE